MTFQRHIVRRQFIELEVQARMDRLDIQNRIARLFHDRLVPVIDRYLSLNSQPGRTDKIERLEIDLGKLHISRLEKELLERIEEELQTKFSSIKMDLEPAVSKEDQKPLKGSDIELITYFLQTGAFPWWAVDPTMSALEEAFENVQGNKQAELRRVLSHLFRDSLMLQRCVCACSDNILEQITEVCLPEAAAMLAKTKRDIGASVSTGWSEPGVRQLWWYCVIRSAVVPPSEMRADIVEEIVRLFKRLVGLPGYDMQAMDDYEISIHETTSSSHNRVDSELEVEAMQELTVQLGILSGSLPAIVPFLSSGRLQEVMKHLKRVEEAIGRDGAGETAAERMNRWKQILHPVAAMQKIIGEHSVQPHHDTRDREAAIKPQQAVVKRNIDRIREALTRLASQYVHQSTKQKRKTSPLGPGRMQTSLKKLWQRPAKDAIRSRKLYDAFNDSDKVYIQNSGLVLLWPYLNRFFMNIGLAGEKAFIDDDAAERACLILQYMVAGDAENIFEAQLPLNKIICGLDLYQPVNTQWVMEADEQEVADGLLDAVMQNAPLWKNLSPNGFRQAYLRREGMLSTRDGHWLLQVKRETYDVMVDRLPWTIQIVKLPWMEHLIFVEWQQS